MTSNYTDNSGYPLKIIGLLNSWEYFVIRAPVTIINRLQKSRKLSIQLFFFVTSFLSTDWINFDDPFLIISWCFPDPFQFCTVLEVCFFDNFFLNIASLFLYNTTNITMIEKYLNLQIFGVVRVIYEYTLSYQDLFLM